MNATHVRGGSAVRGPHDLSAANQRLRNLRQLNGMTQKALGAELGIGQAALSQIEHGDRPLTAEHMVIARRRFDIPFIQAA